jgi:hypothetical protein
VSVNGWSDEEVERLVRKTRKSRPAVERFCAAVDKRLFLLLDERQRRATLHFHLGPPESDDFVEENP